VTEVCFDLKARTSVAMPENYRRLIEAAIVEAD
jgi:hypothetical protein